MKMDLITSQLGRVPSKIAVFRALQLGDLLCAVPFLRALRGQFTNTQITLIGLPWSREFAARYSFLVDQWLEFPGWPGLPEREVDPLGSHLWPTILANQQFEVVFQVHGTGSVVNDMIERWQVPLMTGFTPGNTLINHNHLFMKYPDTGPEIYRLLSLLPFLNIPDRGEELNFPVYLSDETALWKAHIAPAKPYIVLHPGARAETRRWGAPRFAQVGNLAVEAGFDVIITGTQTEEQLAEKVAALMRYPALIAAGKTTLGSMAALLKHARLLVANSTGAAHLAAALHTPSFIIYTGTDMTRWAALDKKLHDVYEWDRQPSMIAVKQKLRRALKQQTQRIQRNDYWKKGYYGHL